MKEKKLKIIPLGGLYEIGKNMTLYEYDNQIIVVDVGVKFPDEELLGIDLVLSNWNYLIENKSKLRGVIITHGHEDHIGGVPYFLKDFDVPIYGSRLTIGIIESKLKEHSYSFTPRTVVLNPDKDLCIGDFIISPIRVTHSIPDSFAFAITTPVGTIIQTGDFKVDYTPIDGHHMDLQKIAEIGSKGVLALLADSTNALRKGFAISEAVVGETLDRIFKREIDSRIIIASFASNIHRLQQIINASCMYSRKVALSGRSMENAYEIANRLGYLKLPNNDVVIDIKDIDNYKDSELTIITTGSQGETFSSLTRMSNDAHSNLQVRAGDTVIFSSTPIPGNEKSINRVINKLFMKGANVIYHDLEPVHVSGHACQEELKLIQHLVKPKFFIPVHGEYAHLRMHAKIAETMGIDKDNIFIVENGTVVTFTQDEFGDISVNCSEKVEAGPVLIDGLGIGDIGNIVLRDRKILSEEGLIVLVMPLDENKRVSGKFDLITRGFVFVRNSEEFLTDARDYVQDIIDNYTRTGTRDWTSIKKKARAELGDYIFESMKRRPMIITVHVNTASLQGEDI